MFVRLMLISISFFIFSLDAYSQYNLVLGNTPGNNILFSIEMEKVAGGERVVVSRSDLAPSSYASSPLYGNYSRTDFATAVINAVALWADFTSANLTAATAAQSEIEELYEKVLLNRLPLTALNSKREAGIVKILSKKIKLETSPVDLCRGSGIKTIGTPLIAAPAGAVGAAGAATPAVIVLEIDKVSFEVSDNFLNRITIDGSISDGQGKKTVSIDNNQWSISFKKYDKQINSVFFKGVEYFFCYSSIFIYKAASSGAKSFHVQDVEFKLKPSEEKILLKRGLDQYLSINIFSDYFGLYASKANSPLSMSFSANMPLNLIQNKRWRFFEHGNITINSSVLNNFGGIGNSGEIIKNPHIIDSAGSTVSMDTFMLDHFDLIRFQNFSVSGYLTIIGHEIKEINTRFHVGLGAELYVSGFKYAEVTDSLDISKEYNIVSGAPFINLIAQYRPDQSFGINMEARIKYLGMLTSSNAIPQLLESDGIYDKDVLNKKAYNELKFENRLIFTIQVDAFAHINKKGKSGVFARLGAEVGMNKNIFPRILLGYSTNLDSYINSIREN